MYIHVRIYCNVITCKFFARHVAKFSITQGSQGLFADVNFPGVTEAVT